MMILRCAIGFVLQEMSRESTAIAEEAALFEPQLESAAFGGRNTKD